MSAGLPTLANLQTINNENLSGQVADELLEGVPLVRVINTQMASNGDRHQWLRYDDPVEADFRAPNVGLPATQQSDSNVTIDCKLVSANSLVDASIADAYQMGGRSAWVSRDVNRRLRTAFARIEKQVLCGTAASTSFSKAGGFEGLPDQTELAALSSAQVIEPIAGGGATNLTAVWVIRSAEDSASLVLGNDGDITIGTTTEQAVESADGLFYNGLWTPVESWYAYQHGSKFSAVRIANVDSAAATPQITDDDIGEAVALFPTDRPATHIVYNRNVWKMHRASRTATNATGSEAPFPTDAYGLPIIVTDQVPNDYAVVS